MSRQQEPLVSVVTPVYNGAKYLRECLASLIAQSYANWRCALVNNRSTDDSLEIALHYASLDSRITVHNNAEFLPIIDNLNRAYALIDRDCIYCKPLMADDWLYPECIATMVSCALAQPSIGDRKSTRLNSSHSQISYAVFCLKKKTMRRLTRRPTVFADLHRPETSHYQLPAEALRRDLHDEQNPLLATLYPATHSRYLVGDC